MKPAAFSDSTRDILKYFPNINTMVVNDLACLETAETLPATVTSVVTGSVDFKHRTDEQLRFADRVVEIRNCVSGCWTDADLTLFPAPARLTTTNTLTRVTLPRHRLNRLRVWCGSSTDPFDLFPPGCAERIAVVYSSTGSFSWQRHGRSRRTSTSSAALPVRA